MDFEFPPVILFLFRQYDDVEVFQSPIRGKVEFAREYEEEDVNLFQSPIRGKVEQHFVFF